MIGPGLEGASFNAYAYGYDPGLEGLLEVRIEDSEGNLITGPTTDDIIEIDVGGVQSVYRWVSNYPPVGEYIVIWEDPDGVEAAEELISGMETVTLLPGPSMGPCQDWITSDEVAACCDIEPSTQNEEDLALAASMASDLLYLLSARKFNGVCVRTVRPCNKTCACAPTAEGWYWRGTHWWRDGGGRSCGCACTSQITLSSPVRAIVEVKIDGDVIAPDEYRVDEFRYLVRKADSDGKRQAWPSCQRLDLDSTEPGTFEITYFYGQEPPSLGQRAAAALACELFRACPSGSGECALPSGVTRIIRQGLTIEKVDSIGSMLRKGATGIPLVDAFIAGYNPTGALAGPAIWSPDSPAPRRVG